MHEMDNKLQIITTWWTIDKDYGTWKWIYNFHIWEPVIWEILNELGVDINTYDIISLLKKDSQDITDEDRQKVWNFISSSNAKNFMITHGTDTMPESAKVLEEMMLNQNKTAVLVWSARPYSMKVTDALDNIKYALGQINILSNTKQYGAYICMNNKTFPSHNVEKKDDGSFWLIRA